MKTTSYQVERQTPKGGWETASPEIESLEDAVKALRAHAFLAELKKAGETFRLVKTARTVVRA